MPQEQMRRAAIERSRATCSSSWVPFTVFPAADFPVQAKRRGARLVIINREPTDIDERADVVIHEGIGDTLSAALVRTPLILFSDSCVGPAVAHRRCAADRQIAAGGE